MYLHALDYELFMGSCYSLALCTSNALNVYLQMMVMIIMNYVIIRITQPATFS